MTKVGSKDMNTEDILKLIEDAEREAGALVLHAGNIISRNKTGARNVVTEYDVRVQELLQKRIKDALPDAHFFCEESDNPDKLNKGMVFVIDPIDGTMNFVKGFRHSCISIGYSLSGIMTAGAVYNPFSDEMFTAIKGKGAFLNGCPITCGDSPLSDSVVCAGTSPYSPELWDKSFSMIRKLFDEGLDIRRSGSAELDLCYVAAGRSGLYFELSVSFWDYAAGYIIAREAGAVCMTAEGTPLPFDESKPSIIAGTPRAVEDYLTLFSLK